MKRFLHIFLTVLFAAAALLSCTREKNYGSDYSKLTEPLTISIVPDYEDGAVDRIKGTLLFDVKPDWALDLVVDMHDLSIFSFDLLPVQTKGSESPCVNVTGASKVDERLQLNVTYDGFVLDTTFSACLKIQIGEIESISNAFNVRLEMDRWFETMIEKAYDAMPIPDRDFSEVATDDAVTNVPASMTGSAVARYRAMAAGEWTASSETPLDIWDACYETIFITNTIQNNKDKLPSYWTDEEKYRLLGEARGLRGIAKYYLLRNYSGYGTSGNLLGVPILNDAESYDDVEWKTVPRRDFGECVDDIDEDLDFAIHSLPLDKIYYRGSQQALDQCIALAFKTRMMILAASPAFFSSGEYWNKACQCSQQLINQIRSGSTPYSLPSTSRYWFEGGSVDNTFIGPSPVHGLWCIPSHSDNSLELNNLPPSFGGNGEVNPSQDLIDAFGMANGYPLDDQRAGYDVTYPYNGRDPRMCGATVFQHEHKDTGAFTSGGKCRPIAGASVIRENGSYDSVSCVFILRGNSDDVTGKTAKSTRTGYYLRKPLREDVTASVTKPHAFYRIRLEEVYLSYAEAANEVMGPTSGNPSPYDIIKTIRQRAGISSDDFLESIKNDKDKMRELICNERRVELCFDGVRFWDLRRWKDVDNLKKTVTGGKWEGGKLVPFDVETRNKFQDYMIYCPIPQRVLDKCPAIEQNAGW